MQKIHRRKNEQIMKEFTCPQGCGKAYGSYAALYTHVKNKHKNSAPPEMKSNSLPKKRVTGKKGRPIRKQKLEMEGQIQKELDFDCKICQERECICLEAYSEEQIRHAIRLMSDDLFIRFTNSVGQLAIDDKCIWIRNTQDEYHELSRPDLNLMIKTYNKKYGVGVSLKEKWLQFLQFSSKYWDEKHIVELYETIFTINTKPNLKQMELFFLTYSQSFEHIQRCLQIKMDEFKQFMEIVNTN